MSVYDVPDAFTNAYIEHGLQAHAAETNARDEVARQALSYIMQRDPDIVADAIAALEPHAKWAAVALLAELVEERLDVLRKVTA